MLPLEEALDAAGAGDLIDDWNDRKRGALIHQDLKDLSYQPAAGTIDLPLENPAAVAGALYVLEGSRLGGRFLARRVGESLPQRYLDADQRPGAWPKLLERLDAVLADPTALDAAIQSALLVFAMFEHSGRTWLARS